jgi:hypothetical protein
MVRNFPVKEYSKGSVSRKYWLTLSFYSFSLILTGRDGKEKKREAKANIYG